MEKLLTEAIIQELSAEESNRITGGGLPLLPISLLGIGGGGGSGFRYGNGSWSNTSGNYYNKTQDIAEELANGE